MKPRRRISSVSTVRRQRLAEYGRKSKQWKAKHFRCDFAGCVAIGVDIHHVFGRSGKLLTDERFWKILCRPHHDWVHANPDKARAIGLLAPTGCWNDFRKAEDYIEREPVE